MESLSHTEFLVAIVVLTALTSSTVFFLLWLFWLRGLQKRIERIGEMIAASHPGGYGTGGEDQEGELVAKIRLKSGEHIVSIVEEHGKRFLRVDGKLTDEERDQMLRYLKDEGFIN